MRRTAKRLPTVSVVLNQTMLLNAKFRILELKEDGFSGVKSDYALKQLLCA